MRLGWLVPAALLAAAAAAAGDAGEVTGSYIGGTHSVVGVVRDMPVLGELPISSSIAVCQQNVSHPLLPKASFNSPGVGGVCALPLPSLRVNITVADATFGALEFEYQGVDEAGEPCGPLGVAKSGAVLTFGPKCVFVSVWPAALATYGTIKVRAV